MALDMKKIFEFSVDNITKYGDTDIFPFPIEKHIMFDEKNSTLQILEKIHTDYDKFVTTIWVYWIQMGDTGRSYLECLFIRSCVEHITRNRRLKNTKRKK